MKFISLGYVFLTISLVGAGEISPRLFANLVLEKLKSEKISDFSIIIDPYSNRDRDLVYEYNDLIMNKISGDKIFPLTDVELKIKKTYYKAGIDYFVVALNETVPVFALYHDGTYPDGYFSLYFCELVERKIRIGGRLLVTEAYMDENEKESERQVLFYSKKWKEP
ncbi:MAG: hypothetical protein ABJQ29_07915 [Luteolibacter sp.]